MNTHVILDEFVPQGYSSVGSFRGGHLNRVDVSIALKLRFHVNISEMIPCLLIRLITTDRKSLKLRFWLPLRNQP